MYVCESRTKACSSYWWGPMQRGWQQQRIAIKINTKRNFQIYKKQKVASYPHAHGSAACVCIGACERVSTACASMFGRCQVSVAAERLSLCRSTFVSSLHIAEKRNFKSSFEWNIGRRKIYLTLFRSSAPVFCLSYIHFIPHWHLYWLLMTPSAVSGARRCMQRH